MNSKYRIRCEKWKVLIKEIHTDYDSKKIPCARSKTRPEGDNLILLSDLHIAGEISKDSGDRAIS